MATAQEIANATGLTEAYGRMLLDGSRTPSLRAALKIYDQLGDQLGPLRGLDPEEIEIARKMAVAA